MKVNYLMMTLSALGVKYTNEYAERLFRENPDKNNFFGLSYMLSTYGIDCKGYRVEDKGSVHLETPFVAQAETGFRVVVEIKRGKVKYRDEEGWQIVPEEAFLKTWTGNVLLVKKTGLAIEPHYEINRRTARTKRITTMFAAGLSLVLFVGRMIVLASSLTPAMCGYIMLSVLGLFISVLLLQRQLHIENGLGDKICGMFKGGGCEEASMSAAAKTVFNVSWSEVGVGYFLSNIVLLSLSIDIISVLGVLNLLSLPYTLWSLWYQKARVRHWCVLCVFIQIILWGLFLVYGLGGLYHTPLRPEVFLALPFYALTILCVHHYAAQKEERATQEKKLLSKREMLCSREVFSHFLKRQPYYEVREGVSDIVVGNPKAEITLTMICNPYCLPCAEAHEVIARLPRKNSRVKVQYVFSSHKEDLVLPCLFLIASFYQNGEKVINEWYSLKNRKQQEKMIPSTGIESRALAEKELSRHKQFLHSGDFKWTPTLLINGYMLPSEYSFEDIEYILFE